MSDKVASGTLFFGFPDLRGLVTEAELKGGDDEKLVELISGGAYLPATSIDTYLKRSSEENFPFDELDDLRDLKRETDPKFDAEKSIAERGEEFLRVYNEWKDRRAALKVAPEHLSNDKAD